MGKKKVIIKPKTTPKKQIELDNWVGGGESAPVESPPATPAQEPIASASEQVVESSPIAEQAIPEPVIEQPVQEIASTPVEQSQLAKKGYPASEMKRMTIDIPKGLHMRIKQTCAAKDKKMAEELRRILEESFPPLF